MAGSTLIDAGYYPGYLRGLVARVEAAADALLDATQQGDAGAQFRTDHLKPSGAIGFYYPDFVAVQKVGNTEVNWILETQGRVWEDTDAKDAAVKKWCSDVSERLKTRWEFRRVNEPDFRGLIKDGVKVFDSLLSRLPALG